jgi:hypothetical protein
MEFKFKVGTVTMMDSIDEMTLGQYLEFSKIAESLDKDEANELSFANLMKTIQLVGILTRLTEEEIDELEVSELNILSEELNKMLLNFNFSNEASDRFEIDGVLYGVKDVNHIDNGEYISLNILREQTSDSYDVLPKLLAVLVRPATVDYDFETKTEKLNLESFNRRDIENLEHRAKLFYDKALAKDVIPVLNFFLNLREE